jgi:transposase
MQGHQSYQQQLFSIFNMEALIPQDHLLRKIDAKIDFEFVREMTAHLYCLDNGRPSVDPVLFIRTCLITYLYDIPSDRQVCEEIRYNLAYRWFCRLSIEDAVPDHSSLTRIRDRLGEETFKKIFDHVVRLCIENGLVAGKKVMMDGSLLKADAALNSLVLKEPEKKDEPKDPDEPNGNVTNIKDSPPKKLPKYVKGQKFSNKTHISKTDPESTLAGKEGEPKQLRYKEHCTIDRDSRIILDAHITTGAEVDGHQMFNRMDHIEETFGLSIEEVTADRGYGFGINLDGLDKRNIRAFVPNFRGEVGDNIDPDLFKYNEESDTFTCQQGRKFERKTSDEAERESYARRYGVRGNCGGCPLITKCFEGPPKQQHPRKSLVRNIYWELQLQTKEREKTRTFRRMVIERQWKMEGVFAEGKENHGLGRARYRGRAKVQIQAYMIAVVQNIKRMMGCGPVVEVGLHQVETDVTRLPGSILLTKLKLFFGFLDQAHFA